MTNKEEMFGLVENTKLFLQRVLPRLHELIAINQNPGCGGDGSMTAEEWTYIRDIINNLEKAFYVTKPAESKTLGEIWEGIEIPKDRKDIPF